MSVSIGTNRTSSQTFILLGFYLPENVAYLMFLLYLQIYLITISGNVLIIALVTTNQKLHRPMYFFLFNLAILDIFFTNTTAPTLLRSFLPGVISISVTNCIVQSYTYFLTGTAEFFLFAVMSFDRYIAICHPLHYNVIMCKKVCIQFICGVLIGSFISVSPPLILFMRLTFCFNQINHFFCDIGPLLMNSCTETQSVQLLSLVNTSVLFFSLIVTVISYISIMVAILRIKSKDGRDKAFSTCSSHAIVVALVFGSCMLMYVRPVDGNILDSNKKLSILNTVIVPLINPYVYTLRNKLVKESLKQALNRTLNRSK